MIERAVLTYHRYMAGSTERRRASSWQYRKRTVALVLVGGFTVLVLMAAIFGEQGLLKVRQLEGERRRLEDRVAIMEEETRSLRTEVRGFHSDPFLYEKEAREKLGLVKPGEVVYDLRPDPLEPSR